MTKQEELDELYEKYTAMCLALEGSILTSNIKKRQEYTKEIKRLEKKINKLEGKENGITSTK